LQKSSRDLVISAAESGHFSRTWHRKVSTSLTANRDMKFLWILMNLYVCNWTASPSFLGRQTEYVDMESKLERLRSAIGKQSIVPTAFEFCYPFFISVILVGPHTPSCAVPCVSAKNVACTACTDALPIVRMALRYHWARRLEICSTRCKVVFGKRLALGQCAYFGLRSRYEELESSGCWDTS